MSRSFYNHKVIEKKWQKVWKKERIYETDIKHAKHPFYNLMMFPYPSAEGLHVGNMYAFTGADVYGRYKRMQGYDVFEPIGLDGFGIHSENYALKVGVHPRKQAKISEKHFYSQLHAIGNGFSWDHKLETYDPEYYRWTQWIFIQMFRHNLAYRKKSMVNFCPSCKTVLADEQVEAGVCERCKNEVTRKEMNQWFFRITAYADKLLSNIAKLNWPQKIKTAQIQWIGKKEGISIIYPIIGTKKNIVCFTTRPDTNFGASFIVLSPEVAKEYMLIVPSMYKSKVAAYIQASMKKTEQQRLKEGRKKTGVFTGLYVLNRLNNTKLPVWIADFVLKDVGTGAVVGVPGHDKRDFEFAKTFNLPIYRVVAGPNNKKTPIKTKKDVYEGDGKIINSQFLNNLSTQNAIKKAIAYLEKKGWGKKTYNYHLRDWLISRQRYWGPPIPMVYCRNCGWQPIDEKDLPVLLPDIRDWKPKGDGKGPLENAPDEWLYTQCPSCGTRAKRETDVSDTFLDSSWYFLRYPSIKSKNSIIKKETSSTVLPWNLTITRKWLPVTSYIGGAEHAVLHLLYSRFIWMVFKDWGFLEGVKGDEPFPFLFSHGLIIKDGAKMSKSRGNVIVPDTYIEKYGADTLRMYLMFLGPYDKGGDFRDSGISGMHRFIKRLIKLYLQKGKIKDKSTKTIAKQVQITIKRVTEDIDRFKYNTAIAHIMKFVNVWKRKKETLSYSDAEKIVKILAPFAPHVAEELFQTIQKRQKKNTKQFISVHQTSWPQYETKKIYIDEKTIVIQVNGKVRSTIVVKSEKADHKDFLIKHAREEKNVKRYLSGKKILQVIVVPQRLINFVTD